MLFFSYLVIQLFSLLFLTSLAVSIFLHFMLSVLLPPFRFGLLGRLPEYKL